MRRPPPELDSLQYRTPEPDDAGSLLLHMAISFQGYRAFAPPGWQPPDELTPEAVERCRAALDDPAAYGLMAVHGSDPVAHVLWVPARDGNRGEGRLVPGLVHLRQLFVLEPWWGMGVARTLHGHAVAAMRDRGWRAARLFTPAAHARARRFYEREGWTLEAVAPDADFGLDLAEYRLRLG